MAIPKIPKLPINLGTLNKAAKLFESESTADTVIEVLVDLSASSDLISLAREVLKVRPGTVQIAVEGFHDDMPHLNREASLIIVVAGSSSYLKRIMEISLWSELNCVVLTEDALPLVSQVADEDALDIAKTLIEVDLTTPKEALEQDLARWCIGRLPELRLSLGVAFPFMRQPIALDLTRQTAFENTLIASIFFLPGADMPILTLNQCKLLYQIAVINEVPLSRERLADAAVVIASAFGFRGITRLVLKRLTPIGWLVRGSTAFGATMTMGHLAHQLYSKGGGVVELARGDLSADDSEVVMPTTAVTKLS
ncbi:MAG: hypothetical protein FWE41_00040 [Coriobacteriia bacterium]|nr:hypothetical protein [Coriobacteriia bacterium]MCL2750154.1 hypothetical protein [Coriobacteriia bacterium]